MNLKPGCMLSRAVLLWASVFDQFDNRDRGFPLSVDQFSNILAARVYDKPTTEQRDCAKCVAFFLHNNYLTQVEPDAYAKPFAKPEGDKLPCWRLENWVNAFCLHVVAMGEEWKELKRQISELEKLTVRPSKYAPYVQQLKSVDLYSSLCGDVP